jgi:hypothetical protein
MELLQDLINPYSATHTLIELFTKSNERSLNDVSCVSLWRLARKRLISFILMSCSFQSYLIIISEGFCIAANSEPKSYICNWTFQILLIYRKYGPQSISFLTKIFNI